MATTFERVYCLVLRRRDNRDAQPSESAMPLISSFYGAIHRDELMADWSLAVKGQPVFPIDPLK